VSPGPLPGKPMRAAAFALVLLAPAASVLFTAEAAEARSFRVAEIPNGSKRSCQTCHETSQGVIFNSFGSDVRAHLVGDGAISERHVDWAALAALDSDGDGATNGTELGDPAGTWRVGDPSPQGDISAPGDPTNSAGGGCGDGQLAASETCDSDQLRGATCENQNLGQGEMMCGLDCRLDPSDCDGSTDAEDDGGGDAPVDEGGCSAGGAPRSPWSMGAVIAAMAGARMARRRRRT
jgi:hypothetical protein